METLTLTNMCMVTNEDGKVLMQKHGGNWPGWCFPGGHIEKNEPFFSAVIREVYEETGLTIESPMLCGVKQFFRRNGERYIVLLYQTDTYTGQLRSSPEGEVCWMLVERLYQQELAPGFEEMLPVFLQGHIQEVFYLPDMDTPTYY